MPELPEVEVVVRGLRKILPGRTIQRMVDQAPPKSSAVSPSLGRGGLEKHLPGRTVQSVERRGKNILIALDNDLTLWVHLKMTGRFRWIPREEPIDKHDLFIVDLAPNGNRTEHNQIRFNDYRRFGRWRLFRNTELWQQEALRTLGPEPLEMSADDFVEICRRRPRMIKPALLDQSFIAGVGNIYADESLYANRLHPKRLTTSVSKKKLIALHATIQEMLRRSIRLMGTTSDSYYGVNGKPGTFQKYLRAYNREGEPCDYCGRRLTREKIGSRSAVYCTSCQRLR